MSEKQRLQPSRSSAPPIADLLVALTRLMLRGSGEGSFRISSTVEQVAQTYGVSADLQALPDSAVLIVRTDEGEWSTVIHEVADIPRLDRAAELRELVDEIDGGRLSMEQGLQRGAGSSFRRFQSSLPFCLRRYASHLPEETVTGYERVQRI